MQQPQFEAVGERERQIVRMSADRLEQVFAFGTDSHVERGHADRRTLESIGTGPAAVLDVGHADSGIVDAVEIVIQALAAHVQGPVAAIDRRRVCPARRDRVHHPAERTQHALAEAVDCCVDVCCAHRSWARWMVL